jgi:hypothetical protein
MSLLGQQFEAWEKLIREQSLGAKYQEDGGFELRRYSPAAEQLAADALQERCAQRYVREHFERLGFAKVDGPFHQRTGLPCSSSTSLALGGS